MEPLLGIITSLDWRPGVSLSVVMGRPPPHRSPVLDYGQPSLDMIEKIGNWIQIVAAGGESSEDRKINKNYCYKDWDNINCVTKEGIGVGVTESQTTGLVLCDKILNVIYKVWFGSVTAKGCSNKEEEDQYFVHCGDLR